MKTFKIVLLLTLTVLLGACSDAKTPKAPAAEKKAPPQPAEPDVKTEAQTSVAAMLHWLAMDAGYDKAYDLAFAGRVYANSGKADRAKVALKQSVKAKFNPSVYAQAGLIPEAIDSLKHIKKESSREEASKAVSLKAARIGKYDAVKALAETLPPGDHVEVLIAAANHLLKNNRKEAAHIYVKQALALSESAENVKMSTDEWQALAKLSLTYSEGEKAAALYEKALAQSRGDRGVLVNWATSYAALGQFDLAIETKKRIKRMSQYESEADIAIANEYMKLGKTKEAKGMIAHAEKIVKKIGGHCPKARSYAMLAGWHKDHGAPDKAKSWANKALKEAAKTAKEDGIFNCHQLTTSIHGRLAEAGLCQSLLAVKATDEVKRGILTRYAGPCFTAGAKSEAAEMMTKGIALLQADETVSDKSESIRYIVRGYAKAKAYDMALALAAKIPAASDSRKRAGAEILMAFVENNGARETGSKDELELLAKVRPLVE